MLELKINCEDVQEAQVYLNAFSYLNLITDLDAALRLARKHGTPADVLKVFDNFMSDLSSAAEHHTGAY